MTSWEAGDPETVTGVWNTGYVPLKTVEYQEWKMLGTNEDVGTGQ